MALLPWKLMRAPMRISSGTCMKRFSKMVSVIIEAPSATVISAMNCACMSVAKPGKGSVTTSVPRRPLSRVTCRPVWVSGHVHAGVAQHARHGAQVLQPRAVEMQRAAGDGGGAGIGARLDAVRHDGVGGRHQRGPALDRSRSVPMPSMRAPIRIRHMARSPISGSRAALTSSVSPRARQAAISRFSVAPDAHLREDDRAPRSPPAGAFASM
jgi:hypothetical protein